MPLDAAKDALIALQGQLTAVLAARNAELEARVTDLEERLARLERTVSRNLRDRDADVLRFLGDLRIPPTPPGRARPAPVENPAEDLRPAPLRDRHP